MRAGNATPSLTPPLQHESPDTSQNEHGRTHPSIPSGDSDAIVPRRLDKRDIDKQSTEYFLKSGIAGGLAGCAVRAPSLLPGSIDRINANCKTFDVPLPVSTISHMTNAPRPGQNRRRAPRPRQNPLPGIFSILCEIHWLLDRRCHRHARHLPLRRGARPLPRTLRDSPPHLPLRRYQVPRLRTSSCTLDSRTRSGNTDPQVPVRQYFGLDERVRDLPA